MRAPGWRHRLEFPAGKVLYETAGWVSHPRVSPKGDLVAFLDHPQFGDDAGSVALIDRNGKKTTLSAGWTSAQGLAWSPSGEEIWFTATEGGSNRALHAVTRSGRQRLVARSPGVLTLQDISADGRALINHSSERIGMVGLGADGKAQNLSWLDWSRAPCLSEDGGTVAFTEEAEGRRRRILGLSPQDRRLAGRAAGRGRGSRAVSRRQVGSRRSRAVRPVAADSPSDRGGRAEAPAQGFHQPRLGARRRSFPTAGGSSSSGSEPGHGRRTWVQDLDGGKARPITPEGVVGTVAVAGRPARRRHAARIRRWLFTRSRAARRARSKDSSPTTCSCAGPPIRGSCTRVRASGGH